MSRDKDPTILPPTGFRRRSQPVEPPPSPPHTGFTRRSRSQKLAAPPPEPPLRPLPEPQPELPVSPKNETPNPITAFFVGLALMFLTGYGVKSCIFQTPPDDNVAVLSPENAAAVDAASRTCDAMHSTRMVRSCRLDIAMTNIVVAINTSQSEAVKMCRNSVEQIHGVTDDFAGTGWDLMIVSPLTGDTLAICGLGF